MPRLVVPVPTSGLPAQAPHRPIDPLCNFENNITSATFLIQYFSRLKTVLICTSCASAEFLPPGTSDGTGPAKLSIHFAMLKITSRTLLSSICHPFFQNSLHLLRPKHHLQRNVKRYNMLPGTQQNYTPTSQKQFNARGLEITIL